MARVKLAVEDRDGSDASRALVERLEGSGGLRVRVVDVADPEAEGARERVADGDVPAGLLIGAGYGAALARGEDPPLVLYRDPGTAIEQQIVAGSLMPILFETSGERLGQRALRHSLELFDFPVAGRERASAILDRTWEDMARVAADSAGAAEADGGAAASGFDLAGALTDVLGLAVEDVVGSGAEDGVQKAAQQSHAVSGLAVMMLLFGLVACGGTLLEEEVDGTLDRLRLAPGAGRSILAGKFLFTWIVGMTQLVILFLYASLVFAVPVLRAPAALLVLSAAVAAAATGFGVLFAVLCRTRKQLEGLSTIVILAMSAFGGSWWPLAITPEWYQKLAHFTLTAWAMDGYQGLFWYGKDLAGIALPIGVLLAIAGGTSGVAAVLWRRRIAV
jgi:ABC-2 type transport system permease protein